jgi:ketosteroid isomerase-like protein
MRIAMLAAGLMALSVGAGAATRQAEDPAHAELRSLRDALVDAVNKKDVDALLRHLHPDVVVTWQNAEVSRKHAGVRAYLARMLDGPDRIVDEFTTNPSVDELTILHGGATGISFGSSRDHFNLRGGQSFDLNSRWSAAVVRQDGRWLIASFHASVNMFDNPLLAGAQRLALGGAAGALILGLVAGYIVARRRARRAGR